MTNLDQIKNRDYTLILDKSSSMGETDVKPSRWAAAQEATLGLARKIMELDPDGITVYAFSNRFKRYDNVNPEKVAQLFTENEPNGSTNLTDVLKDALDNYFFRKERKETKPNGETFLVITDGVPDDEPSVVRTIIAATKKMDRDEELAISFIQVGRNEGASAFLQRLDDKLTGEGAKFDIVDTVTMEELGDRTLTDVLISAIND